MMKIKDEQSYITDPIPQDIVVKKVEKFEVEETDEKIDEISMESLCLGIMIGFVIGFIFAILII